MEGRKEKENERGRETERERESERERATMPLYWQAVFLFLFHQGMVPSTFKDLCP
jgi:hypothetical protein